jgi:sarcosine oxidase
MASDESTFDLIVIGLGVMGLSTVYQALRANPSLRVLGLEQFEELHDKGSSHGEVSFVGLFALLHADEANVLQSRLTRQAYSEGLAYVPLILDAHREWDALGAAANTQLLHRSGVVYISSDKNSEVGEGGKAF